MNMFTVTDVKPKKAASIFAKIKMDATTGCWLWTGSISAEGYGYASWHHKTVYAHRLVYAWLVCPIPNGKGPNILVLDHICNNRACCNPAHLALILPRQNVMRTNAPPALNYKKELCPRGHKLSARHPVTGRRRCSECEKLRRQAQTQGLKLAPIVPLAGEKD